MDKSVRQPWRVRLALATKRGIDLVTASALILATAPLVLAAAIAIKLEDGGPALYVSDRIGRNGKSFRMFKLRSMKLDAGPTEVRRGFGFKSEKADEITAVGRFIRATSIDELPQLLNVLNGTMSMVGVRPLTPSDYQKLEVGYGPQRPGLTGLWQVLARDNQDITLHERLNAQYVEQWSLLVDLTLMAKTAYSIPMRAMRIASDQQEQWVQEQAHLLDGSRVARNPKARLYKAVLAATLASGPRPRATGNRSRIVEYRPRSTAPAPEPDSASPRPKAFASEQTVDLEALAKPEAENAQQRLSFGPDF